MLRCITIVPCSCLELVGTFRGVYERTFLGHLQRAPSEAAEMNVTKVVSVRREWIPHVTKLG